MPLSRVPQAQDQKFVKDAMYVYYRDSENIEGYTVTTDTVLDCFLHILNSLGWHVICMCLRPPIC